MAGYSFAGKVGSRGEDRIWARCLFLQDAETHDPIAWVFLDLMSASLALHAAVGQELLRRERQDLVSRFVLTATHGHSSPGKFYGSSLYDRFASPRVLQGFDAALVLGWARLIVAAMLEAEGQKRLAEVRVVERDVYGVSYNRSFEAWLKNGLPLADRPDLEKEQRAVNPVLTAIVALRDGQHLATAGFFACHGTALGPGQETYDRDWFGVTVDSVEDQCGGLVALGGGTSGDVSPRIVLSPGEYLAQGQELKRRVGSGVGEALAACIEEARSDETPAPLEPLPLTLHSGLFEVTERDQWPRFQIGVPMLRGSEDGGSNFVTLRWVSELINEGFTADEGPQAPKAPMLGGAQGPLLSALSLDISRAHPWHRVRLGDHLISTMPGEPTGPAGAFVAAELQRRLEVASVTVIGYSGDYAGYFTTREEFDAQHYEGGSTLYGPESLACFVEQAAGPDRPIPLEISDDERIPEARSDLPVRELEVLLQEGFEHPEGRDDRRVVFGVERIAPGDPLPAVRVTVAGQGQIPAVVRRFPHFDRLGSPDISTLIAVVPEGPGELERLHVGGQSRNIVSADEARWRFSAQGGKIVGFPPRRTQPWFLLSAAVNAVAFALGMLFPADLLSLVGLGGTGMREFALRMVALTPGLLAVEHFSARATPDAVAAIWHARSGMLFWVAVTLMSLLPGFSLPIFGFAMTATLVTIGLHERCALVRRRYANPMRERWEFWPPLYFVSWLTLVVGVLLMVLAPWFVRILSGGSDVVAAGLVGLFGLGFVSNTLVMAPSSMSRDLRVIRGQLRGSLLFDTIAPTLFVLSVTSGTLRTWTLGLAALFVGIDVWFFSILARVTFRIRTSIERPSNVLELARRIRDAAAQLKLVRILGSGHSIGPSVHADQPPGPSPERRSQILGAHLSLDRMDKIISVDRARRRITVQAGMHLGLAPNQPRSADNNLLGHLFLHGWALPDLGGVVHQSLAGFLATGSSGGSLKYAFADAVEELRYVDGTGVERVARRGQPIMDALLVSMGLLGPVVEVTLRCEPRYMVRGREVSGPVSADGVLTIPRRDDLGLRNVDLTAAGELETLLRESDYHRMIWWPQEGVQQMILWEGVREAQGTLPPTDYPLPPWWELFLGGLLLTLVGRSYGRGLVRASGRFLLPLLPWAIRKFIPTEPVEFYGGWDRILPMDTRVDDYLLPTEFTELWFPLDMAHEVMAVLLELYRDPRAAGTFSCELYTAVASEAWLSPAYQRDVFRVDVFWFGRNYGDPVLDYFPQFWERFSKFSYRCHWGKYLPGAGTSEGAARIAREYVRLPDFEQVRRAADPNDIFPSTYYRRHLGI